MILTVQFYDSASEVEGVGERFAGGTPAQDRAGRG